MKVNNLQCSICGVKFYRKPSYIKRVKIPACSKKCAAEVNKSRYLGDGNPNNKYKLDHEAFKELDTEEKAYVLGFIASDGSVSKNTITIEIHEKDYFLLKRLRDFFCEDIPIKKRKIRKIISISITSKRIVEDVCSHLKIKNEGKKDKIVRFPEKIKAGLERHFIRGFFDGDGHIREPKHGRGFIPSCDIASNSIDMLKSIAKISKAKCRLSKDRINWEGVNSLDFLGQIYEDCSIRMPRKYCLYQDVSCWEPSVSYSRYFKNEYFKFSKTKKEAVNPFKERVSDSGYDLTIIEKVKDYGEKTVLYDTGIKVKPAEGYYFDLVPRSSLSKTGYMLSNSIGVIDRSYVGSIKVPLTKIDESMPDIELPFRAVQLIPRKVQHFEFEEVDDLEDTDRGSGGFGSTGR